MHFHLLYMQSESLANGPNVLKPESQKIQQAYIIYKPPKSHTKM